MLSTGAVHYALVGAVMLLVVGGGCVTGEPPVTSHGGPVRDHVSLVDNLRAAGLRVDPAGPVSQPFLTVAGQLLQVDGETIQVFEYPDEGASASAAGTVSSDGSRVGTSMISWVGPPHFYRKEKVLVICVGQKASVLRDLEDALGPQFAGR